MCSASSRLLPDINLIPSPSPAVTSAKTKYSARLQHFPLHPDLFLWDYAMSHSMAEIKALFHSVSIRFSCLGNNFFQMTVSFLGGKDWAMFIGLYIPSEKNMVPCRQQEPNKCMLD